MKHSQLIGVLAVLALIGICFMPWVYIVTPDITVTGLQSKGTFFGKPGIISITLGLVSAAFFAVPKVWAKRTNVFLTAIAFAWSIKNYIVLTSCMAGECPEKKAGIFLQLAAAFIILVMAFLPKIELPKD